MIDQPAGGYQDSCDQKQETQLTLLREQGTPNVDLLILEPSSNKPGVLIILRE